LYKSHQLKVGWDAMTIAELLGKQIRRIRTERGIEMNRFAAKLGRTYGWVAKLELGRAGGAQGTAGVSVDELSRIATLLGVDLLDLFCDPDDNVRHRLVDHSRHAAAQDIEEVDRFLEFKVAERLGAPESRRAVSR